MTDRKSDQWRADRELLRTCARVELKAKEGGIEATVIYCLISHMRGKMHMKTYRRHHGGWRYNSGGASGYKLENLADQEAFLKKQDRVIGWFGNPKIHEAAQRIINGYEEEIALSA